MSSSVSRDSCQRSRRCRRWRCQPNEVVADVRSEEGEEESCPQSTPSKGMVVVQVQGGLHLQPFTTYLQSFTMLSINPGNCILMKVPAVYTLALGHLPQFINWNTSYHSIDFTFQLKCQSSDHVIWHPDHWERLRRAWYRMSQVGPLPKGERTGIWFRSIGAYIYIYFPGMEGLSNLCPPVPGE